MTSWSTSRRTVLFAAAALTATGCGSDGGDGGEEGDAVTDTPEASEGTGSAEPPEGDGEALARTSDIPVGGGTVFRDEKVVVTQPTAGEFKAFSAVCTHQGCLVNKVADGTIDCPCHASKFSVTDGSVVTGPATRPLPAERITVSGETISLA
ncbi:Rieske (2Fe-2S) protein [Streptomyces sp. NPDC090109]|uniref:Rieske (2Fe-2S) protein n=1 Tax=Streptomyces sp. NPDC090109 TaxID=3365948 RepID=UPI0037FB8A3F